MLAWRQVSWLFCSETESDAFAWLLTAVSAATTDVTSLGVRTCPEVLAELGAALRPMAAATTAVVAPAQRSRRGKVR
jgi:hypothetical protein